MNQSFCLEKHLFVYFLLGHSIIEVRGVGVNLARVSQRALSLRAMKPTIVSNLTTSSRSTRLQSQGKQHTGKELKMKDSHVECGIFFICLVMNFIGQMAPSSGGWRQSAQ